MFKHVQARVHSMPGLVVSAALGVALVTVLSAGIASAQMGKPSGPSFPSGMTSAKAFKNIRVLKTLPARDLLPTMRQFSASLGVGCDFCHVEGPNHGGFELDTKPTKRIARKMILMNRDINHRFAVVGSSVTCYTCHHGHAVPESSAPERGA
jgi:hypothetical protein